MTQEDKFRTDNRIEELHGGMNASLVATLEGDEFIVGTYGSSEAFALLLDKLVDWCDSQYEEMEGGER